MNNDLISREALKIALHDRYAHWGDLRDYKTSMSAMFETFNYLIDNAPAVENITVFTESTDEKTIADLKEELQKVIAEKRPKGEWIKVKEERCAVDMSGEIVTRYKCSKCGRVIATFPNKLAEYYPFCHCGAKMKGGAEE